MATFCRQTYLLRKGFVMPRPLSFRQHFGTTSKFWISLIFVSFCFSVFCDALAVESVTALRVPLFRFLGCVGWCLTFCVLQSGAQQDGGCQSGKCAMVVHEGTLKSSLFPQNWGPSSFSQLLSGMNLLAQDLQRTWEESRDPLNT